MSPRTDPRRVNRLQNLAIVLLFVSAFVIFASLPLFGSLSDRSLFSFLRDRARRENSAAQSSAPGMPSLAFPVRMVYTNAYARLGADALTTLSDEFEHAGAFLAEAAGSAGSAADIQEAAFLSALRGEGLYFDFTSALPTELFAELLGASPSGAGLPDSVRRVLLTPASDGTVLLYVEDGERRHHRYTTAASSAALTDYLSACTGEEAEFAFLLGEDYARLSPYALILSNQASRGVVQAASALSAGEDAFLRRAEFNAHAENRFTESSGTVIVRELASTLYLRPDGTVDYQGGEAAPDSIYRISSGSPTPAEVMRGTQALVSTLLRDMLGDAELYLSDARERDGVWNVCFDLLVKGTPIRFPDGSHAVTVTVEEGSVTAFSVKMRRYTLTDTPALLLPLPQAAAIARVWRGSELNVVYVDDGAEELLPTWVLE